MGGHRIKQELIWVDKLVFAEDMKDSDSRHSTHRARVQAQGMQLGAVQGQPARKRLPVLKGVGGYRIWLLVIQTTNM